VPTGESPIDATPQGEPTRPLTDFDRRAWALMGSQEAAEKPVVQEEPLPPEHPLRSMDHVLITPHNAFAGEYNGLRCFEMMRRDLKEWLNSR